MSEKKHTRKQNEITHNTRSKTSNRISLEKFLFIQIILLCAFCFWKPDICPAVPGKSIIQSTDIFINILVTGTIISTLFALFTGKQNYLSIYCDLAIPIGIYIALANLTLRRQFILSILISFTVLSLTYVIHMIVSRRKTGIRFTWNYRLKIIRGVQILFAICFGIIIAVVTAESLLGDSTYKPGNVKASTDSSENTSIEDNLETLQLLKEEKWETLDYKEKLNVLQIVADIEQSYLGIPKHYIVNIGSTDLHREYTGMQAYWNDDTREIIIDINLLTNDTSVSVLDSVLHESYHSCQYQLMRIYESLDEEEKRLYFFKKAEIYEEESRNYITARDDWEGYYNQKLEADARAYAEERAKIYFAQIK